MLPDRFAQAMDRIVAQAGRPGLIISALSGGMDSVALLRLLVDWNAGNPPGFRLLAAHLNHGLRGAEADLDQEFCAKAADALGVRLAARRVDVARTATEMRLGIEETGRLARYRFFRDLAEEEGGGGALVVTGHHLDDQVETILLNMRRGAHRRGLSGMREFSLLPVPPDGAVQVGRPLLRLGREAIREYAAAKGLAWREDASNLDLSYERNNVRHCAIPFLETLIPDFRDWLLAKAGRMGEEEEKLCREAAELIGARTVREAGGRFFRLDETAFRDREVLLYSFRHIIEEEMGGRLPYGAVLSRLAELGENGRLGETLTLPGRLAARKERDGLFFYFPLTVADDRELEILLPDPPFEISAGGLLVKAEWLPDPGLPPEADRNDPKVEWLNPANIRWPLKLRPPRPGERFRPMGAPGSRKIQDILTDVKSPRRTRGLPRLLADHAGGLWLWPYRIANRVRLVGGSMKALRMTIREES